MYKIGFKRLTKTAKLPKYANPTDGGCDFYADEDVLIKPKSSTLISTGIAWQPLDKIDGFKAELRMVSKSGLSVKKSIEVGAGEIDDEYRGEIKVHLYNLGDDDVSFSIGDKIAQGVIDYKPIIEIIEIDNINSTSRGANGFGSTGDK